MDTTNIELIYKKLETEWADWADDDDGCISISKKDLMSAIQVTNAYIVRYDLKTRIEEDPSPKVCEFCGNTYVEAEPVCKTCLLKMKFRLRRLSCLLNEKDLFKIYTEPVIL